jgi:large subunit ribosomal protein L18
VRVVQVDNGGEFMNEREVKLHRRERRKRRIRHDVLGTPERPRLSVFRSIKHISAQLIDDINGSTLCAASSNDKSLSGQLKHGGNVQAAKVVGHLLGERARMKGVRQAAFDRNGYKYHGRVKALADSARETGLLF